MNEGCDRTSTVSLTVEDFRFTPEVVRIGATSPVSFSIYNAGREVHEFDSPMLLYSTKVLPSHTTARTNGSGLLLEPGESVQFTITPPAGAFLYTCRRKGHANMRGTLVVESS
jgi:uncharacterized cupredoxin-like copper-binding protein